MNKLLSLVFIFAITLPAADFSLAAEQNSASSTQTQSKSSSSGTQNTFSSSETQNTSSSSGTQNTSNSSEMQNTSSSSGTQSTLQCMGFICDLICELPIGKDERICA